MDNNYFASVKEHAQNCFKQLELLSKQLSERPLTLTEYYAAERLLQVLIEAAIGVCKHRVKTLNNQTPTDAYAGFLALQDAGQLSAKELIQWKKIIGLRNILVHDYLKIERNIIENILKQHHYQFVYDFIIK